MSVGAKIDPSVEMVLLEYQRERLYGEVVVKYEAGKVVLIKETTTIKPSNLNNRSEGERDA